MPARIFRIRREIRCLHGLRLGRRRWSCGGRAGNLANHAVDRDLPSQKSRRARHSFIAGGTDLHCLAGLQVRDDLADAVTQKVDMGDRFIAHGNGLTEFHVHDINARSERLHFLFWKKGE